MSHNVWNSQNDGTAPQQPAAGGVQRRDQPEYGQYKEPEYGEMASRYPGWNPYVYGAPEPDADDGGNNAGAGGDENDSGSQGSRTTNPIAGYFGISSTPSQRPDAPHSRDMNGSRDPNGPANPSDGRYHNGIDLDDPNQNPLYGRWDFAAIVGFVTALIGVPVLPIILCALSMYRTKLLRMKGRGLAIAGLVIGLLNLAVSLYMLIAGVDVYQLLSQLYGVDLTGGSGDGTSV